MDYPEDVEMLGSESSLDPTIENTHRNRNPIRGSAENEFTLFQHNDTKYFDLFPEQWVEPLYCRSSYELETEHYCGEVQHDPWISKCYCLNCSNKAFNGDLADFNFDLPDLPHVLSFQLPENDPGVTDEDLASKSFSTNHDLRANHVPFADVNGDSSKKHPPKQKRKRKNDQTYTANQALALLLRAKDALQSSNAISQDALQKILQIADGVEQSHQDQPPTGGSSNNQANLCLRTPPAPVPRDAPWTASTEPFASRYNQVFSDPSSSLTVAASSPRNWVGSLNSDPQRSRRPHPRTLHHCTFASCDRSYSAKSDWRRHEESVHKQRYMCKECSSEQAHPHGGYACGFCMDVDMPPFLTLESVRAHIINCADAREVGCSFSRIDKLREHLRRKHAIRIVPEDAFDWVYDIGFDNDWLQECGFCGIPFRDWDFRINHISVHFKEGAEIANWKIPFRGTSTEPSQTASDTQADSESDNDANDEETNRNENGEHNDHDESQKSGKEDQSRNILDRNHDVGHRHTQNGRTGRGNGPGNYLFNGCENDEGELNSSGKGQYTLRRYLSLDEQHERLVLGLGRHPLSVKIGFRQNPQQPNESHRRSSVQDQTHLSPAFDEINHEKNILTDSNAIRLQVSDALPHPNAGRQTRQRIATHGRITGRVDDYIHDKDSYAVGYKQVPILSTPCTSSPLIVTATYRQQHSSKAWTVSSSTTSSSYSTHTRSSANRGSLDQAGFSATQPTSRSSAAETQVIPWHVERTPAVLEISRLDIALESQHSTLPCEFAFNGCHVVFPVGRYEDWFNHNLLHFAGNLPQKAICWFCDDEDAVFEAQRGGLIYNWKHRMEHIARHFETGLSIDRMRPDYWLIEHLMSNNLISLETYQSAMQYTERPACLGLMPLNSEPAAMIQERERRMQQNHDLDKEKRQSDRRVGTDKNVRKELSDTSQAVTQNSFSHDGISGEEEIRGKYSTMRKGKSQVIVDQAQGLRQLPEDEIGDTLSALASTRKKEVSHVRSCSPLLSNSESSLSIAESSYRSSDGRTRSCSRSSKMTVLSTVNSSSTFSSKVPCRNPTLTRTPLPHQNLKFRLGSQILIHQGIESADKNASKTNFVAIKDQPPTNQACQQATSHTADYKYLELSQVQKQRVPDNEQHYITTTTNGRTIVHDHKARMYDPGEPRASDAVPEDYKHTQHRRKRDGRRELDDTKYDNLRWSRQSLLHETKIQ